MPFAFISVPPIKKQLSGRNSTNRRVKSNSRDDTMGRANGPYRLPFLVSLFLPFPSSFPLLSAVYTKQVHRNDKKGRLFSSVKSPSHSFLSLFFLNCLKEKKHTHKRKQLKSGSTLVPTMLGFFGTRFGVP